MSLLTKNTKQVIESIKEKTGNSPDIIIKQLTLFDTDVYLVMNETLIDKTYADDYVLKFLSIEKSDDKDKKAKKPTNVLKYLEQAIPTHKNTKIDNYDDLFYNLLSGFSIVLIDGYDKGLALETRAKLDSGILEAKNEQVLKGPKDAFTENYQTNIGLIRKRIRTEKLWLEEIVVGTESKTKVGIMYIKDIAGQTLVDTVIEKIKNINIDGIFDSNYIIEMISKNKRSVFPNYISTERPDKVGIHLLDGRIAIIVENTQCVLVIPAFFVDFFHVPEDYYQKVLNINFIKVIRLIAFFIAILGPAFYVAITTYNIEAIPDKLLLSITTQRMGVPFPTIMETLIMIITFEILRETDVRLPNAIGSSLSIVGAIVLGQAAVAAGVVSPITIIVVALTAICGMITYNIDFNSGVRWWRIIFLISSAIFGLFGIAIAGFFFIISVTTIKSFGVPFMAPLAPFYKDQQRDAVFITNKRKFEKRNIFTAKGSKTKQEEKE